MMVELKRNIRCSNCGTDVSFYLSTDMSVTELVLHGRCQQCGNSLQINFNVIDPTSQSHPTTPTAKSPSDSGMVNVDESLFEQEIPSDIIRDLMEE